MDNYNMACNKLQPAVRKAKKKPVKDELDRIKQAEKKKRRLEKALATSAAIRSELEKKKQMKKEEQQRLDEEGAAIAEAVALHVLLGEDSDDSCKLKGGNINLLNREGMGWVPNNYGTSQWSLSYESLGRSPYFENRGWGSAELSAGLIAAQAVSSLRIAEETPVDTFVLNQMLRG